MHRRYAVPALVLVAAVVLLALVLAASVVVAQEEFEIATVNGEDADQVNEVAFYRGEPLYVELDGIDLGSNNFEAYLDDERVGSITEDPDGEINTRGVEIEEREYTLTIRHVHRDDEFESASTQIRVIDTGPDKDDDDERTEPPEATPFEIATVNGEDADQVNEVAFYRGEPLVVELDGIDLESNHFEAYLDDERVGSLYDDPDGEIITAGAEIEEGEYTLTITHVHRGEAFESATTQIEVVDAGPDKSGDEPREDPSDGDGDVDDGAADDVPGFGPWSVLAALGGLGYLLRRRLTASAADR